MLLKSFTDYLDEVNSSYSDLESLETVNEKLVINYLNNMMR